MEAFKSISVASMLMFMVNSFSMDSAHEESIRAWLDTIIVKITKEQAFDAKGIGIGLDSKNPRKLESLHCEGVPVSTFYALGRAMKDAGTTSDSK
jgi:hypothetical protein